MLLELPGSALTRGSKATHIVLRNRRYERTIDADYCAWPSHRLLPAMSRAVPTRKPRLPATMALLAIAVALATWAGPVSDLAVKPIQPQVVMQA